MAFPEQLQYICMWNDASSEFDCGEIYLTRLNLWLVFSNAPVYWPFCRGITRNMGEESSEVWVGDRKWGRGLIRDGCNRMRKQKHSMYFIVSVKESLYNKKFKAFLKDKGEREGWGRGEWQGESFQWYSGSVEYVLIIHHLFPYKFFNLPLWLFLNWWH